MKWLFSFLILAQFVLALVIVHHWLYVTTYRLYVEDRIDSANETGLVWEQFNIVGKSVVPQIFTEGTARLKFAVNLSQPAVLWVALNRQARAFALLRLLWAVQAPRGAAASTHLHAVPLETRQGVAANGTSTKILAIAPSTG